MKKNILKISSFLFGLFCFLSISKVNAINREERLVINLNERHVTDSQEIILDIADNIGIQWMYNNSLDAFEDHMRDLGWIDASFIQININLPKKTRKLKNLDLIKKSFNECIIPYWESNLKNKKTLEINFI